MLQDSPAAKEFIDRLIKEKGLDSLESEVKEQLSKDLLRRLEDRLNTKIVESLNHEQMAKLEHLIDSKQVDKIQDFLQNEGINVNGVVAATMSEFYSSYLKA